MSHHTSHHHGFTEFIEQIAHHLLQPHEPPHAGYENAHGRMTNTAASLPYEQIIGTFMAVDKEDTSPPNHLRWIMQDRAGNAFRAVIFYGLTTNGHQLRRLDIVPQPGEEVIFCGKRREYKPVPYHGHNIVYEVDYLHYWDQHRSGWVQMRGMTFDGR